MARGQGQKGPSIELTWDELNDDERRVAERIAARKVALIVELAELFPKAKDAGSKVRNALRRLVRARIVKKSEPGVYETGRRIIQAKDPFVRAKAMLPQLRGEALKTAALVIAAIDFDGKDSRVVRVCKVSRGFAIPRIKRLKSAGVLKRGVATSDDLDKAIAVAEASK